MSEELQHPMIDNTATGSVPVGKIDLSEQTSRKVEETPSNPKTDNQNLIDVKNLADPSRIVVDSSKLDLSSIVGFVSVAKETKPVSGTISSVTQQITGSLSSFDLEKYGNIVTEADASRAKEILQDNIDIKIPGLPEKYNDKLNRALDKQAGKLVDKASAKVNEEARKLIDRAELERQKLIGIVSNYATQAIASAEALEHLASDYSEQLRSLEELQLDNQAVITGVLSELKPN